ncbi:tRNA-guanine transglycosylase DpdA [Spirosoma spitsbergense]|uniref:tRNA-guanine transglycosylase DpdA n=1 Tax=Spirosoma spitsbergense TaxID=431554 RepID=UPI00037258A1|nr:tRNA-guanine transglycosylase DpdA [Spirosoma spitsbergense]
MKIQIITACTGEKAINHDRALIFSDFEAGADKIKEREAELEPLLMPAASLYTGQQHVRLMKGITESLLNTGIQAELFILSAGYGLIRSDRHIAPYEVTFATMKKKDLNSWSSFLNVPSDFRQTVQTPYDFSLILLGDNYLEACQLTGDVQFGGPTILFCGASAAKKMPKLGNLKVVPLTNKEAKRFSCGLVGLKGELAARVLSRIVDEGTEFVLKIIDADTPLDLLDEPKKNNENGRKKPLANPKVDQVITLPATWKDSSHKSRLRYFIPEWDDLVDGDYNFLEDVHSGGSGDWSNEVYAHQMFTEPNYDGILISKVVAEKSVKKKERINSLGVHRFCRVPREFPIMGDCGAFGYIAHDVPPYSTSEMLDYYTRLDFDLGVSLDHLIVSGTMETAKERYQLTIQNAEDFLVEHRKRDLQWRPIGAVQGWDPKSYSAAAEQYVKMGYDYIALGGLIRTSTQNIVKIVEEVTKVVPRKVDIHLFGLARLSAMRTFSKLGVTSVDSASHLRRAWLGSNDNYWTVGGEKFAAIRIPEGGKSFRAKRMIKEGGLSEEKILSLEKKCLKAVRGYDNGEVSLSATLDTLDAYDQLITEDRKSMRKEYERTLSAKPWKSCSCDICQKDGVEVIIFRGNNRNRRRGFHNTNIFYSLLKRILTDEAFFFDKAHRLFELDSKAEELQMSLF